MHSPLPAVNVTLLFGHRNGDAPEVLSCADEHVLADNPEWWAAEVAARRAEHTDMDAVAEVTIAVPQEDLFAHLYPAPGVRHEADWSYILLMSQDRKAAEEALRESGRVNVRLLAGHRNNTYLGEYAPEVFAAADEATLEGNPAWWQGRVAQERQRQGDDVAAWAQIDVPVPLAPVWDALYPARRIVPVAVPFVHEGLEATFTPAAVQGLPEVGGNLDVRTPADEFERAVHITPRLALENRALLAKVGAGDERGGERLAESLVSSWAPRETTAQVRDDLRASAREFTRALERVSEPPTDPAGGRN